MTVRSTRFLSCVAGLVLIAFLGTWQLVTGNTMVRQLIRMRSARHHVAILKPVLSGNPEFVRVKCEAWTGAGGALLFSGHVLGRAAYIRLQPAVISTRPPVPVVYRILSENGKLFID